MSSHHTKKGINRIIERHVMSSQHDEKGNKSNYLKENLLGSII